ncbi:2-hydroxyacid dehydrogenase 1, partial [Tetrabaena socialis]
PHARVGDVSTQSLSPAASGRSLSSISGSFSLEVTEEEASSVAATHVACFSTAQYVKDFFSAPLLRYFPASEMIEAPLDKETAKLAAGFDAVVVFVNDFVSAEDFFSAPLLRYFPASEMIEAPLDKETAKLAAGFDAVVVFVNDFVSAEVVKVLAKGGVRLIALRCAGYDRVDLAECAKHGIRVVRVPSYSPESVAEHAVALIFALNRHLHEAHLRTRMGNYSLSGLVGVELKRKGIGCKVIAHDVRPNPTVEGMGIPYVSLDEMLPQCDVISLHCPLLPSTRYIINSESISRMKPGVMVINVSRGGLIDSDALFDALEAGQIGSLGLDVYENEDSLFFVDHTMYETQQRMSKWDRKFKTLLSYPQVLVTPHSAFLTKEALTAIAATTCQNIADFVLDRPLVNEVKAPVAAKVPA